MMDIYFYRANISNMKLLRTYKNIIKKIVSKNYNREKLVNVFNFIVITNSHFYDY